MSQHNSSVIPVFDRFGWYWQPARWLEGMSPQDAIDATRQAIDIQQQEKALKQQAAAQERKAGAIRAAEQKMLDSLFND